MLVLDRICMFKNNLTQTPRRLLKTMLMTISCCPAMVARSILGQSLLDFIQQERNGVYHGDVSISSKLQS